MKKLVLAILFLIVIQFHVFAQMGSTKFSHGLVEKTKQLNNAISENIDSLMLDSIIVAYKNTNSIPGIATMIIKDNQIIWDKNYGYRNLVQQLPVNDSTFFLTGAISKTIITTAVMQLWERGLINLDNDIDDYLPAGMTIRNPHFPNDVITVKMLMTYTSGLLDNWSILDTIVSCGDSPIRRDSRLASFLVNYFTPGAKYYSINNFSTLYRPGQVENYIDVIGTPLLALAVENLTGESFDKYCRDSIFIPLEMNSTSWFLDGIDTNKIAVPYLDSSTPLCQQGFPFYPSISLRTTTLELSHFLMAYLNRGVYNNYRLLETTSITKIFSTQHLSTNFTQGLTWFIWYPLSHTFWGHHGIWDGAETYMCFDPIEKIGIIYFQNWYENSPTGVKMIDLLTHFIEYAKSEVTGVENGISIPLDFKLFQNYPNPFNPTTTIRYSVPKLSNVSLGIYDVLGRDVETLVNENKAAGFYEVNWNAANLPSGVYFYRLQAGNFVETKKMMLMK